MTNEIPNLSPGRIRKGLALFVGFSLIGVVVVVYRSSLSDTLHYLRAFDRRFLALAVALFLLDIILSGVRIWIFARKVDRRITFGAAVRSCLANIFLGGVTPSQTGGAAAQIYVLYREGLALIDSTVVCFLGGFLGTAVVLMACAITFSLIATPEFLMGRFRVASTVSLVLFTLVVGIVLVSLLSPRRFRRAVERLTRWIPPLGRLLERRNLTRGLYETVDRYHELMKEFMLHSSLIVASGIALSALIYLNKFTIAWVVLRGLGLDAAFWDVVYMQVVLILIFYFSPTPGASGLAEVSTAAVMGAVVPVGYRAVFILLWRFFTLVAGMFVGAVVIARYFTGIWGGPRSGTD